MPRPVTRPPLPREELRYAPSLGHELRRFREAFRLNQQEAAEKIGVSQRVLSRWENNQVKDLDGKTLIQLGAMYGLTPNQIARMAGWWQPVDPEDVENPEHPKWVQVLRFLNDPNTSDAARERLIELTYAAMRAVESLEESGGLERINDALIARTG